MYSVKTKEYNLLDSDEIEELAEKHYGFVDFCFIANGELHNGYSVFIVDGGIDSYYELKIRSGKEYNFCASDILDCLAKDGIIPYGNYLINHSW